MKLIFVAVIIFILTFLIGSCKNSGNSANSPIKDSVIIDIPKHFQYHRFSDGLKPLNLPALENGYDGQVIRIWRIYPPYDNSYLVVLKDSANSWSGSTITMILNESVHGENVDSAIMFRTITEPSGGWDSFISKLFDLHIISLPDDSEIKNYQWPMDGDGVTIEYADKNTYRLYTYTTPQSNAAQFPEALYILKILYLLESDLKLNHFVKRPG